MNALLYLGQTFAGLAGQELETENDGTFGVLPWFEVLDLITVVKARTADGDPQAPST